MRVAIRDHQNKSRGLVQALSDFEVVPLGVPADFLLIDHDATAYYRQVIDAYHKTGAKVYLYPHGATAHLAWDGVWPEYEKVSGYLAMSEGQAETMRRYGYSKPISVTGWHWCEQKPFRAWNRERKAKVLFAPIHALNNGFLFKEVKEETQLVFERLCALPVDLKVRYIGDLESCGIERVNDVEYVKGSKDNSIEDIDEADFVVSFGTFAYLSVARGKPTLFYRQDIPYFDAHSNDDIRYAEHWDFYGDYMRYPIDVLDHSFIEANQEQAEWRKLFIGEQITPERMKGILYA